MAKFFCFTIPRLFKSRALNPENDASTSNATAPPPRKSRPQPPPTSRAADSTTNRFLINGRYYELVPASSLTPKQELKARRRGCLIGIIVSLGVCLGFGLGYGLQKKKVHNAISGSGIGTVNLQNANELIAYTQRYDGVIVNSEYQNNAWSLGIVGELNTTQSTVDSHSLVARDGTPLAALSYVQEDTLYWHLFYVTVDNYLADWVNSNTTYSWSPGALRSSSFEASTSSSVGLSACVNPPQGNSSLGARLYYGGSDNIFHELSFNFSEPTTWFTGASFETSNGAGGVDCTASGGSITYIWMENPQGQLQQLWYDFNTSAETPTHPTGTWVPGLTYPDIFPNSSISAIHDSTSPTKYVHFQAQNHSIIELISNGVAENDTWSDSFIVGTKKGSKGTRIGSCVVDELHGSEIHVLFQTNSTNMVDFVRGSTARDWVDLNVPVVRS